MNIVIQVIQCIRKQIKNRNFRFYFFYKFRFIKSDIITYVESLSNSLITSCLALLMTTYLTLEYPQVL
mgnify:CR=1 FL=1